MLDQNEVRLFFDEAAYQRPYIPDNTTMGGWGKYLKYKEAVDCVLELDSGTVLDLGCNIGHVAYLYNDLANGQIAKDVSIVGIDLSMTSLQRAVETGMDSAEFTAASGTTLPFPDESFDLIVSIEVLEHIPDQLQCLREVNRVLKPGGRLFLTTPNPHCFPSLWSHELHRLIETVRGRPERDKDLFITQAQLARMLRDAGFDHFEAESMYMLARPFMALRGWVLTPPIPPGKGLQYQKFWQRTFGASGENLPFTLRDRLFHTLKVDISK